MNKLEALSYKIKQKNSFLCVGLDTDIHRIPVHLLDYENPVLEFNKQIVDATRDYCVAYKPNLAFYESLGSKGWDILQDTVSYIGDGHLKIADAKRGDIGNTAEQYAKTFFDDLGFDAITIAPYMGRDSVLPFLEYKDKWTIVLGLTSNSGYEDFQTKKLETGRYLFEEVIQSVSGWGSAEQLMFVVGATRAEYLSRIRAIIPEHFLLVPGIGRQGGDLNATFRDGSNSKTGLLINSSRDIIYADSSKTFAKSAGSAAKKMQEEMRGLLGSN